ncbi:MAG: hypothetical protein LH617_04460 [Ramlibacter sp.]|nr:hypothetical protein [Ramlibacter sp.]
MAFAIDIQRTARFVRYRVSGPASLESYLDLIEKAAGDTGLNGDTLALVDLRGVIGRLKFTDQYLIGELVGQKLRHLVKLASLVASDPTSYNSETVANRGGLNLRCFDDGEKALAWLLQEEKVDPGSSPG